MTNDTRKQLVDHLADEEKRLYSVNFLLARLTPVDGEQRGEELMNTRLPSGHYQTRDHSVVRFYKNISTPLSRFAQATDEDE